MPGRKTSVRVPTDEKNLSKKHKRDAAASKTPNLAEFPQRMHKKYGVLPHLGIDPEGVVRKLNRSKKKVEKDA